MSFSFASTLRHCTQRINVMNITLYSHVMYCTRHKLISQPIDGHCYMYQRFMTRYEPIFTASCALQQAAPTHAALSRTDMPLLRIMLTTVSNLRYFPGFESYFHWRFILEHIHKITYCSIVSFSVVTLTGQGWLSTCATVHAVNQLTNLCNSMTISELHQHAQLH